MIWNKKLALCTNPYVIFSTEHDDDKIKLFKTLFSEYISLIYGKKNIYFSYLIKKRLYFS